MIKKFLTSCLVVAVAGLVVNTSNVGLVYADDPGSTVRCYERGTAQGGYAIARITRDSGQVLEWRVSSEGCNRIGAQAGLGVTLNRNAEGRLSFEDTIRLIDYLNRVQHARQINPPGSDPDSDPDANRRPGGGLGKPNRDCDRYFLGFPAWHNGLDREEGSCNIVASFEDEDGIDMRRFVWIIVLNGLGMLFTLVAYLALGFIIYGGYLYVLARGDPGRIAKGKRTVISAIVGLIICILASLIVNTIVTIITRAAGEG